MEISGKWVLAGENSGGADMGKTEEVEESISSSDTM